MGYKAHIVVVEDDIVLRKAIVNCYQKNNYRTTDFGCTKGVVKYIEESSKNAEESVDIIVSDIVMPNENGYELINSLKSKPILGKIFISVNSTLEDKIKGLRLGADDYIVKPLDSTELLLRTNALLARINPQKIDNSATNITFLHFKVNPESRLLMCRNNVLDLGNTELQLLLLLIGLQGKTCTKEKIIISVYNNAEDIKSKLRTVDKLVSRLRHKLSKVGGENEYIITQRGKGYLLVSQV